ncbi:hypothetical protein E8E12_004764 [Didymella heteroderae]|uniref:C2H2-type domain-containing protein n=1 Tax=Didymella heteroderae TaxID=1769908 RepID=A0A9P4WKE6_9PLEO|nr:hypothetical protein E8E12_004764 [Didymella heteroderae]
MHDLPYIAGQLNGYSFQTHPACLGSDMAQLYSNDGYTRPSPTSPLACSPVIDSHHDSVYSLSPSQPSGYTQRKAEFQPGATHLTPHFNNTSHLHQSEDMSRETSQASCQSSMSSGLQYDGILEAQMYHQNTPKGSTDMRRALSLYSGVAALQNRHFRVEPGQYRALDEHFHGLNDTNPSASSNIPPDSLPNAPMDDSVTDYQTNDTAHTSFLGFDVSLFGSGQTVNSTNSVLQPQLRPRAKSDVYHGHRTLPHIAVCDPQVQASGRDDLLNDSVISSSTTTAEQGTRRRRKQTPPSDSESERITGHVLASGKFQCSGPQCEDLRFGRQADFRRHYTNVHADQIIEYFCPVAGCERSRKPAKKSKGRSFNGRKDKMQEHVEIVHHKLNKKRRRSPSAEFDEEDDDTKEAEQPRAKTLRHS